MTRRSPTSQLLEQYRALEKRFPVEEGSAYSDLVIPNGNSQDPVHRWFHLKEGFSSQLLPRVLQDLGVKRRSAFTVLDSFVGGGTTLVSALRAMPPKISLREAYGVERNPFLHFLADTKVRAIQEPPRDFRRFIQRVLEAAPQVALRGDEYPALSTFSNPQYLAPQELSTLLRLRSAIHLTKGSSIARDLALLCLAGTIEPVSSLRRDGRALRFVPDKSRPTASNEFQSRANLVAEDLEVLPQHLTASARVFLADGRDPLSVLPAGFRADLALFSPPYPNNIDYTEVYKLEAWLLQFFTTNEQFRNQRLLTLRSHPSVKFADKSNASLNGHKRKFVRLLEPLLDSIPATGEKRWRVPLLIGYFDDMLEAFQTHREVVRSRGVLVYVVGNSMHGTGHDRFLIAADLLLAQLAEIAGFGVERLYVARRPKRRPAESEFAQFLRESVVVLRPM